MNIAKSFFLKMVVFYFLVVAQLGLSMRTVHIMTMHRPLKEICTSAKAGRNVFKESLLSVTDIIANFFFSDSLEGKAEKVAKPRGSNRLLNEVASFIRDPPHNARLEVGRDLRRWTVHITGVEGTPYAGETYTLRLLFPSDYPMRPPVAYFINHVPRHEHIYSNGDICLSLLGQDWRPTFSAENIVVSIQSMLASAKVKALPPDNAIHAQSAPGSNQDNFMYHDDRC